MQTPYNVIAYKDKPRLWTAVEMLRTTNEIEKNLEKVHFPSPCLSNNYSYLFL